MEWAYTRDSRRLVQASHAKRGAYECPTCHAQVHLRSGNQRRYFAHNPGQGKEDCENYYPGGGTQSGPPPVPRPADTRAERTNIRLVLSVDGRSWTTALRLKEIPQVELRRNSFQSLRGAVLVEAGDVKLAELPALRLRPRAGWTDVPVEPSPDDYKCRTFGSWPPGIQTQRWNLAVPGLSKRGAAFHQVGDDWIRIPQGGEIYMGEKLHVVAPVDAPPPADALIDRLGHRGSRGLVWHAWSIRILKESVDVRRWLQVVGLSLVPAPWTITPVTPPASVSDGTAAYGLDSPIVVEVTPPDGGGRVALRLRTLSSESITTVTATDNRPLLYAVTPARTGTHRLTIGDAPEGHLEFDVGYSPKAIEPLRLRLRADDVELPLWHEARLSIEQTRRLKAVENEHAEECLSADVTLTIRPSTSRQPRTVPLAKAIHEIAGLPDAITNWSIDAGPLGAVSVHVERTPSILTREVSGLSAYYRVRGAQAGASAVPLSNAAWRRAGMSPTRRFVRSEDAIVVRGRCKDRGNK